MHLNVMITAAQKMKREIMKNETANIYHKKRRHAEQKTGEGKFITQYSAEISLRTHPYHIVRLLFLLT